MYFCLFVFFKKLKSKRQHRCEKSLDPDRCVCLRFLSVFVDSWSFVRTRQVYRWHKCTGKENKSELEPSVMLWCVTLVAVGHQRLEVVRL